jgi:hypothetical protein
MDLTSLRGLPSLAELQAEGGGIPSSLHASDHVPIGARFSFFSPNPPQPPSAYSAAQGSI